MIEIKRGPAIMGIGMGVPERVMPNDELAKMLPDTSDEWIRTRVGIRERRIATPEEATSDFAVRAAIEALKMAKLEPGKIDQIIVATVTPDHPFPSTAAIVQGEIGAENAWAVDMAAACAGSIYELAYAYAMHEKGMAKNSLVVGADTLSKLVNWDDRATAVLFGDGAGAVIVQNIENPGIAKFILRVDGKKTKREMLMLPAGGSRLPASLETVKNKQHFIKMDGRRVYIEAVSAMEAVARAVLQEAQLTNALGQVDISKVDVVITHQANRKIMEAVWDRLKVPEEKRFANIERYGNTSAASIYIAMYETFKEGKLHKDDILLLVAFGAGLTYAAAVLQWHLEPPRKK